MKTKFKEQRPLLRPTSSNGYRRGELGKEILLLIAAGMAIPAAFLMPNIPIALRPLLRALTKKMRTKEERALRPIDHLSQKGTSSLYCREGWSANLDAL